MNDSILDSIKKLLGIGDDEAQSGFDMDIMIHINTALQSLRQIGVGPEDGFSVEDNTSCWIDLLGDDYVILSNVKSYVYLKVKMLFDPPTSSIALQAMENSLKEIEWRIYIEKDK